MIPAFENKELRERFEEILRTWLGTPYRHLTAKKGVGADCTLFVGASLLELGLLKKLDYSYYPPGWHQHTTKEYVLESFDYHISNNLKPGYQVTIENEVDRKKFIFGDCLIFSTGIHGVSNHCAIWLDRGLDFINSIEKKGCCIFTYGSWWEKRCKGYLRLWRE